MKQDFTCNSVCLPVRTPRFRRIPIASHDTVDGVQELCRTAWALGRLGLGGVLGTGGGDGGGGGVESEDDGAASTESGSGGEIWKLMDKLVGECSKWLELFTPQVKARVLSPRNPPPRKDTFPEKIYVVKADERVFPRSVGVPSRTRACCQGIRSIVSTSSVFCCVVHPFMFSSF